MGRPTLADLGTEESKDSPTKGTAPKAQPRRFGLVLSLLCQNPDKQRAHKTTRKITNNATLQCRKHKR